MSDPEIIPAPLPHHPRGHSSRRRLWRGRSTRHKLKLLWGIFKGLAVAGIGLAVILYFVGTSSWFIRSTVLPRLGRAIHADLTASEVSFSPFSQLTVRGLKLQPTGGAPLLLVPEARVRYSLWSLWRGTVAISEISLVSPSIDAVQKFDGTGNWDQFVQQFTGGPTQPLITSQPKRKPLQLAVHNLKLTQGSLRWTHEQKGGVRQTTQVSQFNLSLDKVQNSQPGKLQVDGQLQAEHFSATGSTTGRLSGHLGGALDYELGAELLPRSLKGNLRAAVPQADGRFQNMASVGLALETDLTPAEVRQLTLRFEKAGQSLGQLKVSGPLELARKEGRLKVELFAIDRRMLNLLGDGRGWDFGQSTINSTNQVELTGNGSMIAIQGQLVGRQIGLQQTNLVAPPLDLDVDYLATVNLSEETAVIRRFNLTGQQRQMELLRGSLDRAMNINWGNSPVGVRDSVFNLTVTNVFVADWRGLLGTALSDGQASGSLRLRAQQDARILQAEVTAHVKDLAMQQGATTLKRGQLQLDLQGQLTDFKRLKIEKSRFQFTEADHPVVSGSGSLTYDLASQEAQVQTKLALSLPELLRLFPVPAASATLGSVEFNGIISQDVAHRRRVQGSLALADVSGRYANYAFQQYSAIVELDVEQRDSQYRISRGGLATRLGMNPGGLVNFSGDYDLITEAGQLSFQTLDLNQNALQPVFATLLAPRTVKSMAINSSGTAKLNLRGESSLKAEFDLGNLVVVDPQRKFPDAVLGLQVQVDASLQARSQVTLRRLGLALRSGSEPGGSLEFKGQGDISNRTGRLTFKIQDINQYLLNPFVALSLAPRTLTSIQISGGGSAQYDPHGDSMIEAEISADNVVVRQPGQTTNAPPVAAQLVLTNSLRQGVVDVKQLRLSLPPTPRAHNQIQLVGRVDCSQTNVYAGQLTLKSEALDLTPAYEWYRRLTNASPAAAAPPVKLDDEPAAIKLPFDRFGLDLNIDRLYLGDVAITNWLASAKINQGAATLNPFQMLLNGAPIKATGTWNPSLRGHSYDLSFQADKIPLGPLANTFLPTFKEQMQGDLSARGAIQGAGFSGTSLQKNLAGHLSFDLTNANLQLVSTRSRPLLAPVKAVLGLPELDQSPVDALQAGATLGQGRVEVTNATARSSAFHAESRGQIRIAPILTNSTLDFPVVLALRRSLAQKARLLTDNTPTNVDFVPLPGFVHVVGTLGVPDAKVDRAVITGLLLRSVGSFTGGSTNKNANLIQDIGSLLTGEKRASTNQPASPAGQTNNNVVGNILSAILGGGSTNTPQSTNAPPSTNQPPANPLNNLLQDLLNKKN